MGKDLRRAVDYAEIRPDLATDHLAYYGVSWGGNLGGLMPAVEPRVNVSVLLVAGLARPAARAGNLAGSNQRHSAIIPVSRCPCRSFERCAPPVRTRQSRK